MNNIRKLEKKDLFKTSLFIGISLIVILTLSNVITGVVQAVLLLFGYSSSEINNFFFDTWTGYLYNTVVSAIVYTLPFLFVKIINKKPVYETCSFNSPNNNLSVYCIGFVIGLAMVANIVTTVLNNFFATYFDYQAVQQSIGDNSYSGVFEFVFTLVNIAVFPALIEEFAFRGIILGTLRKYGDMPAILFSATIFALFHGNFVQIPFAFIVGIGLGLTVVITNSIWPAIVAHFLNNALAVVINYFSINSAIISLLIFALVIAIGIISLVFLINKKAFRNIKKCSSSLSPFSRFLRMFYSPTTLIYVAIMLIVAYFNKA